MVRGIDAAHVKHLLDADALPPVLDVLPEASYRQRHLPRAQHAPVDAPGFERRVREIAPDPRAPVIVYDDGDRSGAARAAAHKLEAAGFSDVRLVEGGLAAWRRLGEPFEGEGPRLTTGIADTGPPGGG